MNFKEILKITFNLVVIYVIGGVLLAFVYAKASPIMWKNKEEDKKTSLQAMLKTDLKITAPKAAVEDIKKLLEGALSLDVADGADGGTVIDAKVDLFKSGLKKISMKLMKAGATKVEQGSAFTTIKAGDWEPDNKHAEFFEVHDKDNNFTGFIIESYAKGYSSYPGIYVALDKDLVIQKLDVLSHAETPGLGDEIMTDWFRTQFKGKDLDHLVIIKGETEDKIQAITGATISTRAVTNAARYAIENLKDYEVGSGPKALAGKAASGKGESEGH